MVANIAVTMPFFLTATLAIRISDDLGFKAAGLGVLLAVFGLGGAISAPPMGRLVERLGAETSLRTSIAVSATALVTIGLFVDRWWHMAGLLFVLGMVSSFNQAAGNLWLVRVLNGSRLGLAFGFKHAGAPASALLAGLAVPTLAVLAGWRGTFITFGVLAGFAVLLLPRTSIRGTGRTAPNRSGDVPIGPLVVVSAGMAIGMGTAAAFTGFAVIAMVEQVGISEAAAGTLFAFGGMTGIMARIGFGRLADRVQGGLFPAAASLVALGGLGLVTLATGSKLVFLFGVPFVFVTGWGWTGIFNQAVTMANANSPAVATGITQAGASTGVIIGPAVFGLVYSRSFETAWLLASAASFMGAAIILHGGRLIKRRHLETGGAPT